MYADSLKIIMKTQVESLPHSEVKLTVEVSEKAMEQYRKQAVNQLQNQVKIEGFRPGKIPVEVLERHLGEQAFMGHVLDLAISETYEEAIEKEKLRPVAYPKLSIVSQDPLKYEAIVPTVPELKWKKDLSKLKVERKKAEVKESDIKEVLKNLQERSGSWKVVERAAKMEDRVEIDFDGFDADGKPLEGTSSKNHPVILGQGSLIPGFEEEVVGMKPGEEKEFKITFPENYHVDSFKKKKVTFKIKLNQVEEPEEVKLDDDFAKEITGGHRKTMKELKDEIKDELGKQKEREEDMRLESEFLKELLDYTEVDLPEALVVREIDFMLNRIKQDLEKRKQTWEDYLKEMEEKGKKLEDIRKELEKPAKEQVIIRLALEKLHEENKTEVSKKELEEGIEMRLESVPPQFRPMVQERYAEGSQDLQYLEAQLKLSKIVKKHTK